MNADKFFEQYSIEEINKRTRISPISLRYIKNKEFEKIQRVKFLGFIKIIEKEFNIDLRDLVEEYNKATGNTPPEKEKPKKNEKTQPKKHNTLLLTILAIVLFSLGAYLLYKTYTSKSKKTDIKKTSYIIEDKNDTNLTEIPKETLTNEQNESNISTETDEIKKQTKKAIPKEITIIPHEKVWYRALNLDNNKSVEFLTTQTKTLQGSNWYVKLGHGNVTITYGDENITPNTKKIVRILLKDGEFEFLKKPNRYEK